MMKIIKTFIRSVAKTLGIQPKVDVRHVAGKPTPLEEDLAKFIKALKHRPLRNRSNT